MTSLRVRSYESGDEVTLSDLFNKTHLPYAGVTVRTPEAWMWSVVQRPGVGPGRVVVIEDAGRCVGYAAVDKHGTIWETAIDATSQRRHVANALVAALLARAGEDEAGKIVVNAPRDDRDLRIALERAGFVAGPAPAQIGLVLDLPSLIEHLLAKHPAGGRHQLIRLHLSDTHPWQEPHLTIDTASGTVSQEGDSDASLHLLGSARTFNRLILEGRSPVRELLSRRIRVRPLTRVPAAIRALHRLRITDPWFHPLGDIL